MTGSVGASTATTDPPAGDVGPTAAGGLPSRGTVPARAPTGRRRAGPTPGRRHRRHQDGGRGRRRGTAGSSTGPDRDTADRPIRRSSSARWPRWSTEVLDRAAVRPGGLRRGLRWARWKPVARTVSPLNIRGWRRFPLPDRLADLVGLARWRRQRRQGPGPRRGMEGCGRGVAPTTWPWSCPPGSVEASSSTADCSTGRAGNAGHIGHVVVEPDGRACACGGRGCLEAEASGTAIAAVTGRPAAEADEAVRRRCGTLVGRAVASVANLLDLQLAVVAGSVALGYGAEFFDAARRRAGPPLRARVRAGPRGSSPADWAPTGPWSGAAAVALHRHAALVAGMGEDGR